MDVSHFVVERLAAPERYVDTQLEALVSAAGRIERSVRVLHEAERQRVQDHTEPGTWEALVRRAEARVDLDEALG